MIVIRLCRTWRREGRLTFFNHGLVHDSMIHFHEWRIVTVLLFIGPKSDYCPALSARKSLTHSVSDVHETWLMWPWRVKMRELLVNIIFRSSLFSWCRIKTKVMLLMMKQNKSHAVDARTKGMLLIKLLHYYWNKVLSAALKIRYLQYNLYNIVVKDAFLKPAFVNAPLT